MNGRSLARTRVASLAALRGPGRTPTSLALAALAAGALVAACSDGQGYNRTSESVGGRLGNGRFVYRCDTSVACNAAGDAETFPENIAVGARFDLEFVPNAQSQTGYALEPASPTYTQDSPRGLVALKAGYSTLLVRDSLGNVVDFQALHQQAVAKLGLADADDPSFFETRRVLETVIGPAGRRVKVRPFARAASGDALAGVLAYTFAVADPAIAVVESSDETSAVLVLRGGGTTTLTVEGGGVEQAVPIVVEGAPVTGRDAGAEGGA